MLVGLIAISVVVGAVGAGALWLSGMAALPAFLYGYICGGMTTMVGVTVALALCPWAKRQIAILNTRAARHDAEGARNR